MLRLEFEIALMEGKLAVKDLPDAWNTKMRDYLGITPPNDAKGVLQDIHWSWREYIGYFPTYALGQPGFRPIMGKDPGRHSSITNPHSFR